MHPVLSARKWASPSPLAPAPQLRSTPPRGPPLGAVLERPSVPASDRAYFLLGGGAMAEAIGAFDWAATPLGPMEDWPVSLKTAVGMMLASRFPKCLVWGPELVTLYNDAFRPILGNKPEALGRPFSDVWAEVWDEIGPIAARAFAGEATFVEDLPLEVERYGRPERAWFTFCYSPVRDETGRIAGMIDTVIETTGKVEAERQARVLNAELAHRIKNTLTVVTSITEQTLRDATSLEDVREVLFHRIAALAEAHASLAGGGRGDAPVAAVVEGALAPHRRGLGRITLDGPEARLSERHALSLALAVNELATNAVKYGALSVDGGHVAVAWRLDGPGEDARFAFSWTETGGPPVAAPARRGFGTRLVERVVASDFRGEAALEFRPEGVRYTLSTAAANLGPEERA